MDIIPLSSRFDLGFRSDTARVELPPNCAYRMKDWIPSLDAPLRRRGPFTKATGDLNAVHAATNLTGVAWAPFGSSVAAAVPQLVMMDENGDVFYHPLTTLSGTYLGASGFSTGIVHPPIWHKDTLILLAPKNIAAPVAPQKITSAGATPVMAALGGTPPSASVGASWGDYVILANGSLGGTFNAKRIWFSDVGTTEGWTQAALAAGSFVDMTDEVVAVVPVKNVILVLGYHDLWALAGDVPPPGGNMSRRDLALGNGCCDARSVARYKDYAIWANTSGIWKSDGSLPVNITEAAGLSYYWKDLIDGFSTSAGWSAAGGVIYGHYIITVKNPTGPVYTTLVFDLERNVGFEFTSVEALMYASRVAGATATPANSTPGDEELYMAHGATARAYTMSSIWAPTTNTIDGDGTSIRPSLETPYYSLGARGRKRMRRLFVTYDLRNSASPTLAVGYVLSPESTSYTTLASVLPATTAMVRKVVGSIKQRGYGIALKIDQTASSVDTRLYGLELEVSHLEEMR